MSRMKQVGIALDQLANAVLGGYADETLSARCWRNRTRQPYKLLRPVIDGLWRLWEREHCKASYVSELERRHLPREYSDA